MSPARAGKRLTLAVALVLAAALLGPPFLNISRFKGRIVRAMEESLGRPVTVDEVSLRLLPLPGFDMKNLVVGDDPRFSAEPLLRAEEVTASLRLSSLWRGRMEISRLSLSEPSLNLVRGADGHWNLGELLLRAAQTPTAPTALTRPEGRPRFPYIEADDGRINLKLGPQKTVFTLSEADFAVWLESEEEIGLRLRARPVRTDANLQDTGELRISGTLGRTAGGRAASLDQTPIKLSLILEGAQLGQLSTLIYGRDRGWRGGLQVNLALAGPPADLALSGSLRVQDFRRYDIVGGEGLRLDATCSGTYRAPADALTAIECHVPSGDGEISLRGAVSGLLRNRRYDLSLAAREVPMATVAQTARRMRRNLPDDLTATGSLNAAFTVRTADLDSGPAATWAGGGSASGLRLRSALLAPELLLGEVKFTVAQGREYPSRNSRRTPRSLNVPQQELLVTWAPFNIPLGGSAPATASAMADLDGYRVELHGEAAVARFLQIARVVGAAVPAAGVDGTARLNLVAAGAWKGFAAPVLTGSAQLRKVRAQFEGIASPVEITAASVTLSETEWSVRDLSASLPAARLQLSGSLGRERNCTSSEDSCLLSFTLHATELSMDDLNRLLNPRLQEKKASWFALGGAGRPNEARGVLRELHAEGKLTVGRLLVKSLPASHVSARAHLSPGRLVLDDVQGEVLGGRHRGAWRADFTGPEPVYSGKGSLQDASMEQLARLMHDPWATGTVDADYDAALRGWAAVELAANAAGSGRFTWKNGSLNRALLPGTAVPLRVRRFAGQVSMRESRLSIPEARLESPAGEFTVTGSASFTRQLDLRVARGSARAFAVTGTLAQPQVAAVPLPQTEAALR